MVAVSTGAAGAQVGSARFAYEPSLDGLRAFAVLAVMLYHADVSWAPGGFLGVDLFFVLSGYLITTLLLREHDETETIDLRGFWVRRARRLLPALFVMVAVVGVWAAVVASAAALDRIRWEGLAALTYVNNWLQILRGSSYFELGAEPSPFRHTWSLAIEEQWYLVWPLAVAGALLLTRGFRRLWAAAVLVLALDSALLMAVLYRGGEDPSRAYYGTDTRAQALLVGSALAFLLHRRVLSAAAVRTVGWSGVGGLVVAVVMVGVVSDSDGWMYHGGFFLVAVAGAAIVAAVVQPDGPVKRLLARQPLPAIGLISYGLYLWHWPVDVALSPDRTGVEGAPLVVLRFAVAFLLAYASYRLVERPVRLDAIRWRGVSKVFVATGALATVAVVAIVVGTLGARSLPAVAGTEEVPAVEPGDLGLMVVGDSVAVGLAFEAGAVSDASGLTVLNSAIVGCGVTDGVSIPDEPVNEGGAEHRCDGRTAQWRDQLERFEPDVVLVGWGAFEVYPLEVDGELLEPGSAAHREYVRAQLEADVDVLAATGAPVAFLNVHCMQEHLWSGEEPRDRNEPERVEALNEVLAGVAADRPEMTILDVRAQVCPDGTYQEEVDGIDLFRDGVHYSQEGARWLWGWLAGEIARVAGEAA